MNEQDVYDDELLINLECRPFDDPVGCCECGHEHPHQAWPVVDSYDEPLVAEQLKERKIFTFTCEKCGTPNLVAYNCIYHDAQHDKIAMLCAYPDERDECDEVLAKACERWCCDGRMVEAVDDLCEKARVFACGLDDRAIELIKAKWVAEAAGHVPDLALASVFFMDVLENGSLSFVVFMPDETMDLLVKRDIYDAFVLEIEMMGYEVPESRVVDHKWASRIFTENGAWQ